MYSLTLFVWFSGSEWKLWFFYEKTLKPEKTQNTLSYDKNANGIFPKQTTKESHISHTRDDLEIMMLANKYH